MQPSVLQLSVQANRAESLSYASQGIMERLTRVGTPESGVRLLFFGQRDPLQPEGQDTNQERKEEFGDIRMDSDGKRLAFEEILQNDTISSLKRGWQVGR